MHLLSSITGRNNENLLRRLSVVPTGQTVLQYSLPHIQAQMQMITSVRSPVMISAGVIVSDPMAATERTIRPYALYGAIRAMSIWPLAMIDTIESTSTP
jgi:hypothetical protein